MTIVYQSNRYAEKRVIKTYARKLNSEEFRVFEITYDRLCIREFDVSATFLLKTNKFNDMEQHALTDMEVRILRRFLKISFFI